MSTTRARRAQASASSETPSQDPEEGPTWRRQKLSTPVTLDEIKRRGGEITGRIPAFGSHRVFLDKFISFFGVNPEVVLQAWALLARSFPDEDDIKKGGPERLLWALMLLKQSAAMTFLTKAAGCDEKTFRRWAWSYIKLLSYLQEQVVSTPVILETWSPDLIVHSLQIVWERRKIKDSGNDCLVSIDGTDFKCQEHGPAFSSHKYAKKSALRYEVGICIKTGDIVWLMGPFAAGDWPDINIFRFALKGLLEENERVEADDGYVGEDPSHVKTPASGYHDQDERLLRVRSIVRQRHETANKRFKDWGILKKRWEYDIGLHGACMRAVVVLTQLSIESGKPLFQVQYDDNPNNLPPAPARAAETMTDDISL